jgi:hypothetical protein
MSPKKPTRKPAKRFTAEVEARIAALLKRAVG